MSGPPPAAVRSRPLLERHVLFGELSPDDREALLACARQERFRAGEALFRKGDPGASMMAVLRGEVRITTPSPGGRDLVLNIIRQGEFLGEIALLDGKERTADALAAYDTEVLVIDRRDFVPFLLKRPEAALRLLAVMCDRLRRTTEQVEDLMFLEAPQRLAKKLLQLLEEHGRPASSGTRIAMPLSQRQLGALAGLARESVNKQLAAWQREGILRLDRGFIVIEDKDALLTLVSDEA